MWNFILIWVPITFMLFLITFNIYMMFESIVLWFIFRNKLSLNFIAHQKRPILQEITIIGSSNNNTPPQVLGVAGPPPSPELLEHLFVPIHNFNNYTCIRYTRSPYKIILYVHEVLETGPQRSKGSFSHNNCRSFLHATTPREPMSREGKKVQCSWFNQLIWAANEHKMDESPYI